MRTTSANDRGITIYYPEEIGFAFLPCIIKAAGDGVASIEATIAGNGKSYTYSVEAFADNCVMDFREYVQAAFDGIKFGSLDYTKESQHSNLGATFNISASAKDEDGSTLASVEFTTFYVWGAMRAGETWNGYKRLTWFTHFPFTFGFYVDKANTNILVGYEGAPNKLKVENEVGIVELGTAILPAGARYWNIYDYDGEIKQGTFTDIFDLTFAANTGGKQSLIMRIERDDTEKGVYLRWVDRHGFYRYWLFTQGDESREISSETSFLRNNLAEYDDTMFGYLGANGRRQGYAREDTIPLCAPLVDRETFDFLQDLASSPVVDMYLGSDKWQSVTIKAGTYTKTTAELQDFVCNLVINNTQIQQL